MGMWLSVLFHLSAVTADFSMVKQNTNTLAEWDKVDSLSLFTVTVCVDRIEMGFTCEF